MNGDEDAVPSKKQKLDNGIDEEVLSHLGGEEEVENDQEFLVQPGPSPGYSGGEDMEEEEEMEEEEDGEESMGEEEKEESEEEQISSNAKNIFQVKAITDLIFSDGNFKEGDDLKNSIDFSETCVQQMFGKDILNDDNDEGESSQPRPNGTSSNGSAEANDKADIPTPRGRGRPRKKKKFTPTSRKSRKREGAKEEEEVEFPAEYLLTTGIREADMEELKLGFTVLQDIMCQACSEIFLQEPHFSEVGDKIEYDQIVERPMWFVLVEQNLCKGAYRNLSELMCDIRLIVENCYKFWKLRDDDMLRAAFKLEDCLLQRLVLLPEDVQKRVSWDLDTEVRNVETNGEVTTPKNFTVQDIRNKSKLFRLTESAASKAQGNTISKESLEADIVDFENNFVFADGNTIIETVNSMWELADIGHFLSLVHSLLRVPQPTQLEVERMFLVPQSSTVLARLMTSLLVRPISRVRLERGPPMPYAVWKSRLQVKVSEWYRVYHAKQGDELEVFESIGIDPMFWNILGPDYNPLESHDYHELHYFQRVWLFKGLCSYVLHNHKTMADLFNSLPPDSTRLPPLGTDRSGNAYFFYPAFIDVRLYRQNMPRNPGSTAPHWVGNYLLLPLHQQQAELSAHRASLNSNPRTPYNPTPVPLEERELFFPKQKFLPSRRKDNLVILANSVEGFEILLQEMKSERQDPKLIQSMEEVHKALKKRESNIDYVTYKARCSMFTEYSEYMKRPDNYEDPDLKYWTFKIDNLVEERDEDIHPPSLSHEDDHGLENGDDHMEEGGVRRSRREVHPVVTNRATLSDLDSEEDSGSEEGGGDFDRDGGGSSDEWAPAEGKKGKKKNVFSKPPAQSQDDKIRPASPDMDELDQMTLQPLGLKTPGSSPAKPELADLDDPLNIASLKREVVDGVHSPKPKEPPTTASQPSRPVIKVKSNQSLVREDLSQVTPLSIAPESVIMPPQLPLVPALDIDPLATRPNVKKEDDDDDIEVLEEKVLKPPPGQFPPGQLPPGMVPGENSIMKIGNLVYQIRPGGPEIGPGTMIRMPMNMLPPGMHVVSQRSPRPPLDPTQQIVIQNARTLAPNQQLIVQSPRSMTPRGRGRPAANGMPRGALRPQAGSPRGMTVMRGSPRGMSPRGRGGMLNITPRKATPPPIPRQLLNRNISVSLVEPKPKPALPKLAGVTITPTKQKPSPAKTLIFNSSMSPSAGSSSVTKSPVAQKTQMVDANVQLQWGADGSTNYVIELANNQTQALTREQVQFFKNKHNGTMPNVVRIAVPVDIARRVKPPCITL